MQVKEHGVSDSKHGMSPSTKLAWFAFIGVAGFYLWTEHQTHLFEYGLYGLILLCPLMHVFMHGGHGGHGGHSGHSDPVEGKHEQLERLPSEEK